MRQSELDTGTVLVKIGCVKSEIIMLNVSRWLCANRIMIVTHREKMILVSLDHPRDRLNRFCPGNSSGRSRRPGTRAVLFVSTHLTTSTIKVPPGLTRC